MFLPLLVPVAMFGTLILLVVDWEFSGGRNHPGKSMFICCFLNSVYS